MGHAEIGRAEKNRAFVLLRDNRGAFMVAGIFMVLFLVAALYTVIGLGRTLLIRDAMQDAADAAAFSSAIFHARGMNLIAFLNIIMAALVAVLVALKLTQSLLRFAALIAMGFVWAMGAGAAAAATLEQAAQGFGTAYNTTKGVVMPLLQALHQAERVTSVVVPWVASVDSMREAAQFHAPAKGAFTPPRRATLPVEVDRFEKLCGKATEYAVGAALKFAPIPKFVKKKVEEKIRDSVQDMGDKTSRFLCGDGSSGSPTHTDTIDKEYPPLPGAEVCSTSPESDECRALQDKVEKSAPDEDTGKCQQDCGHKGAYELRARDARYECQPHAGFSPSKFLWQKHKVRVTYVSDGNEWRVAERKLTADRPKLMDTKKPPCGEEGSLNEEEWQPFSGPDSPSYPDPLCTEDSTALGPPGRPNETKTLELDQATRIFSCTVETRETISLAEKEDALGGAGSERKSPHKVEDGLELGAEAFQIRALAFGNQSGPGSARKGVVVADPRRSEESTTPTVSGALGGMAQGAGQFSVAQAEYFYDHAGTTPRGEWLFNMSWSARLKRFRMPSPEERAEEDKRRDASNNAAKGALSEFGIDSPPGSSDASCADAGAQGCSESDSTLSFLDSLVLH